MRLKREQLCPHCQAPVESAYRFCLACGEELPLPNGRATPPEPVEIAKASDANRTCWQCQASLDGSLPTCPNCGAALNRSRKETKQPKEKRAEPTHAPARRSWLKVATVLLIILALVGGGALMLAPKADEDGGLLSFSGITVPRIFGDDDAAAGEKPAGVAANASEARVIDVGDDGQVRLRIGTNEFEVALAGTSPSFVRQCLGEKALARVRRILIAESIVYVAPDGSGTLTPSGQIATQSAYIWHYDPGSGKVRFANQELLGGGEAAYKAVKMAESEAGKALAAASERAKVKERGRYAPGACE
jgi:hypothetical protein